TAGLTAMLCLMKLEEHGLRPGERDVVVTGAAGGVGSVAVALLAACGYRVVASTGRPALADYLRGLGAAEILDRAALGTPSNRPLESERWAAAIDTVGGVTLGNVIRQLAYGASVAACGLAGGNDIPTTVYPFILRDVNLLGVDSVQTPIARRRTAWERLARELPAEKLAAMEQVVPLADVIPLASAILSGQTRGRVVVDVNA
ncbi:MAG: zinc-binding dehydrogenase, partial [Dehalococcoidia bacterium]|nr:zinc-binding dehydrogenase [Dehalococcoidia bacterium]